MTDIALVFLNYAVMFRDICIISTYTQPIQGNGKKNNASQNLTATSSILDTIQQKEMQILLEAPNNILFRNDIVQDSSLIHFCKKRHE